MRVAGRLFLAVFSISVSFASGKSAHQEFLKDYVKEAAEPPQLGVGVGGDGVFQGTIWEMMTTDKYFTEHFSLFTHMVKESNLIDMFNTHTHKYTLFAPPDYSITMHMPSEHAKRFIEQLKTDKKRMRDLVLLHTFSDTHTPLAGKGLEDAFDRYNSHTPARFPSLLPGAELEGWMEFSKPAYKRPPQRTQVKFRRAGGSETVTISKYLDRLTLNGNILPADRFLDLPTDAQSTSNVFELLEADSRFSFFTALLKECGDMAAAYKDTTHKYTVIAPTDDAIAKQGTYTLEQLKKQPKLARALLQLHTFSASGFAGQPLRELAAADSTDTKWTVVLNSMLPDVYLRFIGQGAGAITVSIDSHSKINGNGSVMLPFDGDLLAINGNVVAADGFLALPDMYGGLELVM